MVRIIGRLNVGGPARQACLLHEGLRPDWETVLVTGSLDEAEGDMSHLLASPQGVYRVPSMSRPIRFGSDLAAFLSVLSILRRERPHIVHTHTAKAGSIGRVAAVLLRIPFVVHTYHGNVFRGYFGPATSRLVCWIERLLNRFTTRVIAVSDSQAEELCGIFHVVSPAKVVVIRNGFDLARFANSRSRATFRARFGYDDSHTVVVWAGRMVPIKNVELLADLIRHAADNPRLRFLVVGDGSERGKLQHLTAGCSNLTLAGWQSEMAAIWSAADVALSTSHNEGTPTALIEAMAAGKPFVATPVGGVVDLAAPPLTEVTPQIQQAANGFLVEPRASLLLHALELISQDGSLAAQMGKEGQAFVLTHHSADRMREQILKLYQQLLARPISA